MKSLKTLVKLNKDKLDKLLAQINKLEEQKIQLKNKREHLIQEGISESDKYSGTEFAYMLDKYLADSRENQRKITAQIHIIELQIGRLHNELTFQYTELKKYEIALKRKQLEYVEKLKKMESKELDEFNTSKFVYENKDRL